eukprot:scaffold4187_cov55-Cyclotella_meneghiniana.AAC.2
MTSWGQVQKSERYNYNFYLYPVITRYLPGKVEGKALPCCPYPDPLQGKLFYPLKGKVATWPMGFLRDYYDAATSYSYSST